MVVEVSLFSVAIVWLVLLATINHLYMEEKFHPVVPFAAYISIIGVVTTVTWFVDLVVKFLGGL